MRKLFFAGLLAVAALGSSAQAAFDTFDTIDPAWVPDRYAPNGFDSVVFDGDNRLQITISSADGVAQRPFGQQGAFYNTQGMQRPASGSPVWVVSADLYVPADLATGNSFRTDLWLRNSNPVEANADYAIIGIIRDAVAGTSTWRVWDSDIGWINLATAIGSGWTNLKIEGDGSSFNYYIGGSLVHTDSVVDTIYPGLQTVFLEAYNFYTGTETSPQSYAVYWDNLSIGTVPEAASIVVWSGLGALGLGLSYLRKKRVVKA